MPEKLVVAAVDCGQMVGRQNNGIKIEMLRGCFQIDFDTGLCKNASDT